MTVTPVPNQQPTLAPPRPATPLTSGPTTYVPLAKRFLADMRDNHTAIGAAMLLGRLFMITGENVPLSPGDLEAYDPALSSGAGRRALRRLVTGGYALVDKTNDKFAYRLTWGQVNGTPVPWDRKAAGLGRPRHVTTVRVDDRLLDLCLGRLEPHHIHPAMVERYVTTPLLGLREIGAYALALTGLHTVNPTLVRLGLQTRAGQPLPLPNDRLVLAAASLRSTDEESTLGALTEAGWRYAGFTMPGPKPLSGEPLFFVPQAMFAQASGSMTSSVIGGEIGSVIAPMIGGDDGDMIGGGIGDMIASMSGEMIGGVIGLTSKEDPPQTASRSRKQPIIAKAKRSHGSTEDNGINPTTTATSTSSSDESVARCGGGDIYFSLTGQPDREPTRGMQTAAEGSSRETAPLVASQSANTTAHIAQTSEQTVQTSEQTVQTFEQTTQAGNTGNAPSTGQQGQVISPEHAESMRLLRNLGIRSDVAATLANRPATQISEIIDQARARSDVRNLAGWVVSALRSLPDTPPESVDDKPVSISSVHTYPGLTVEQRSYWLKSFLDAETSTAKRQVLARLEEKHPRPTVFQHVQMPPPDDDEEEQHAPFHIDGDWPTSQAQIKYYPGVGLTNEERERWIERFHKAETVLEKRTIIVQLREQYPLRPLRQKLPRPLCVEQVDPAHVLAIRFYPDLDPDERERWTERFHEAETIYDKRAIINQLYDEHPRPGHFKKDVRYLKFDQDVTLPAFYYYPGLTVEERNHWVHLFRSSRSPAEKRNLLIRLYEEHPRSPNPEQEQPVASSQQQGNSNE